MQAGTDYIGITTPFYCHDGKGNFLLHKRSKTCRDEQGAWDTGGGKLEFGLTFEQNVLKEVKEEYDCDGKIQESLPPFSIFRTHNGQKTHWIIAPFFILVEKDKVKNAEPNKIDEIGWFTLDYLPKPLHTGLASGLKKFKKHFEKYSQ